MRIKVFDVPVKITWQFLALITFMLSLKTHNVLFVVVFSALHEFGHILGLFIIGNKPKYIALELTGINICRNDKTEISLMKEIIVSVFGPLVNFLFFSIFAIIYSQNQSINMLDIASVNLILGVFNLLPVKGLDGGKILYYFISKMFSFKLAKCALKFSSILFILAMIIYGIFVLYITKYNFTMLIIALMLSLSMFSKEEC